jgi:hypothetical protein
MTNSGIRISQLQELFLLSDDDVFVINDNRTSTMKISYKNFLASIQKEDLVFDGEVIFNGATTVNAIDGGNALGN